MNIHCKQCSYPLDWDKCNHPACNYAREIGFCTDGCRVAYYRMKELAFEGAEGA